MTTTKAKRRVSFEPSPPQPSSSDDAAPTPSAPDLSAQPSKSALRPDSIKRQPVPKELYTHPDQLLRRLRLRNGFGEEVNLNSEFRDVNVVAFYFGATWGGAAAPLKQFHRNLEDFCREHRHRFKLIYVSVDVNEEWFNAATKNKPWLAMEWNDGSSLPDENDTDTPSPPPTLAHNEDFLLGSEPDLDASLAASDPEGSIYVRPFSRVHLAAKLDVIAAPTVVIYHSPSGKVVQNQVRPDMFASRERREQALDRWEAGERVGFSLGDMVSSRPAMFIVMIVSVLYALLVLVGGPEYNVLGQIFEQFGATMLGEER